MFGNRHRNKPKVNITASILPTTETNTAKRVLEAPVEVDETAVIPQEVLDTMSVIRLNWDFMFSNEVILQFTPSLMLYLTHYLYWMRAL